MKYIFYLPFPRSSSDFGKLQQQQQQQQKLQQLQQLQHQQQQALANSAGGNSNNSNNSTSTTRMATPTATPTYTQQRNIIDSPTVSGGGYLVATPTSGTNNSSY